MPSSPEPARPEPGASVYGRWLENGALPVFEYTADQRALPASLVEWDPLMSPPTRDHWLMLGNDRVKLWAGNTGGLGLFDESDGIRWISYPSRADSGVSVVTEEDGATWGTGIDRWPDEAAPVRRFGPCWFEVECRHAGLRLERAVLCPAGDAPWVLVRVRISAESRRAVVHREQWVVRPRFANIGGDDASREADAADFVRFEPHVTGNAVRAAERRHGTVPERGWNYDRRAALRPTADSVHPQIFGTPWTLMLEALGGTDGTPSATGDHPLLEISSQLELEPDSPAELWFRFGIDEGDACDDPAAVWRQTIDSLARALPAVAVPERPELGREARWHAAMLAGGLGRDRVLGGHTLDQGSAYSYVFGFNAAARDPFQHAIPLVYYRPEAALSVLRNTCAWASPDGDLPWALDGAKRPWRAFLQPSDGSLWGFWLAAEYGAATGDLAAFDADLDYHPEYAAEAVPLREHLRRQFRFFVDAVGLGRLGHVRMRNADWSDEAVAASGVPREEMIASGESVLNSALASWVLSVFAGLMRRLGEMPMANEALQLGESLRERVAGAWNGRWFDRAYRPNGSPIGRDDCWLEVQPWALLCGAASDEQADALLDAVDSGPREASPLGARVRWPVPTGELAIGVPGENVAGGAIWFAINAPLVWAASRRRPALAWDEWRRMTLTAHTAAYPNVWEGTLSGPDCYNAPESARAGRTWGLPELKHAMQAFPVNNLHSHAQPLVALLRLAGVEPLPSGALKVGSGVGFSSSSFTLREDGHGTARVAGPVVFETEHGTVSGGPGVLEW